MKAEAVDETTPCSVPPTHEAEDVAAREALALAFKAVGGWEALAEWIKADPANQNIFWSRIWPRLLPLEPAVKAGEESVGSVEFQGLE